MSIISQEQLDEIWKQPIAECSFTNNIKRTYDFNESKVIDADGNVLNYMQIFRRQFVTTEHDEQNNRYELWKALRELRRDIEAVCLLPQEAFAGRDEPPHAGAAMRSAPNWIKTNRIISSNKASAIKISDVLSAVDITWSRAKQPGYLLIVSPKSYEALKPIFLSRNKIPDQINQRIPKPNAVLLTDFSYRLVYQNRFINCFGKPEDNFALLFYPNNFELRLSTPEIVQLPSNAKDCQRYGVQVKATLLCPAEVSHAIIIGVD